ncbi:MAG: hypothetical protein HY288_08890 [Planctomycetia bacterium]|nr:hypothetical protein [Planctomycetia bacterium]
MRIEEDWQLVVLSPDPDNFAPQITCTISPVGNVDSVYAVFDLNLRNLPSYAAGGVQLQIWNQSVPFSSVKSNTGTLLQNNNETVTWTQRMSLTDGQLSFAIQNGNSQTWGQFGNGNSIALQVPTNLQNLNGYNTAVSVANSGVGYSANRVSSLVLNAVRAYSVSGLAAQNTTPQIVYQHP